MTIRVLVVEDDEFAASGLGEYLAGMVDFEDTEDFTVNVEYPYPTNPPTLETRNQRVYSAMVYPLVCFSPVIPRTITLNIRGCTMALTMKKSFWEDPLFWMRLARGLSSSNMKLTWQF